MENGSTVLSTDELNKIIQHVLYAYTCYMGKRQHIPPQFHGRYAMTGKREINVVFFTNKKK